MYGWSAFSHSARIIYGLPYAECVTQQKHTLKFYVQANSFTKESYAQYYKQQLQARTIYPVKIKRKFVHKKRFYAVILGPISSVVELRKTASALKNVSTSPPRKNKNKVVRQQAAPPARHFSRNILKFAAIKSKFAEGNWVLGIGAGGQHASWPANTEVDNGSNFAPPNNVDLYTTTNKSSAVFELSAGRRWTTYNRIFPAYELDLLWQFGFNNNLGGTITQYSEPVFLNYSYKWKVQSNLLLVAAKLNVAQYKIFLPFVTGGIGPTFNLANSYNETAFSGVTERISPSFQDNNTPQFAYRLGAGIDVALNPQILISVGYNYQNLGHVSSGYGLSSWSTEKLSLGSYGQNEFLIKLHYIFANNNMK
ncbi:MAG: hypothetical protein A3F18_07695 [Legionellales bacterium RIFCSPHIGHO2_12_FULL_37_14]|nr:MAG: hypothetical protein A3F18_07695 [Legionellales bacterium RIFCSPHIGHO2_12_FULL_37_14]